MRRAVLVLLPLAWLLSTAEAVPPALPALATASPAQNPTPTASQHPTPTPTALPSPRTGYLALDPTFGPPGSKVTVSGTQFFPGQVQLFFDTPDKVIGNVATDPTGSFKVDIAVPDVAVGPHTICSPQATASTPCANFRVEPKPTPTPSETPSPSPTAAPTAEPTAAPTEVAASPTAGRLDTVGVLTRPPFVFFPVLLVLAAVAAGAWIWWGRRRPPAPVRSAVVRHASVTPRPSTLPTQSPPAPPPPPAPATPEAAEAPPPPRAAPGDESIDMPQPGE